MKLRVVALGHRVPPWVDAGFGDYARRLPPEWKLELVVLKPAPRNRGRSVEQMLEAESKRIAAATSGWTVMALDEYGEALTTRHLAERLARWRSDGCNVAFAVGSADGLHAEVRARAAALWSLSALTLPHGLVRVMVAEQVYRSASLLAGHPYHRE
ncbi:MAG: 23S rRNA (pseudouridine(1915)-N(3))-methyltransferase RlmH [Casimicrobiaceae bacterium]